MNCLCGLYLSGSIVLATLLSCAVESRAAEIVDVRKIWEQAPHNAFTDLLRHDGRWYCVFREGAKHQVSSDGSARVLTSTDGEVWTSAAHLTSPTADLRDPKITIAPTGKLMLSTGATLIQPTDYRHETFARYSTNGSDWGNAIPIGDKNFWIWRITWHKGKAYGIGYPNDLRLFKSDDGTKFDVLVPNMAAADSFPHDGGESSEAALLFQQDDTCLCIVRRDRMNRMGDHKPALLGTARPPYKEWTWRSLGIRVSAPQMITIPDGRIIAAGRGYPDKARTQIWQLDPQKAALKELATLPSGGDNSYPGLVFHDGLLWVSYYSSHEGKASIYLARVKL